MLQKLLTSAGRVYSFVISLVVAAILGVTTWACWGLYQEARLQRQFIREGQLLSVTVDQTDHKQRSWRDIFSNSAYLMFNYRGKAYTTRYVMDTAYVGAGDQVQLLYHSAYDDFRQPRTAVRFDRSTQKSRLIEWTSIRAFSDENRLLLLCLLLTTASFFLISGVIVTIIPVGFLQAIARLVLIVELIIAAIFFTYDTYQYYQYYQHLKTNGHEVTVQVLTTDRRAYGRNARDDWPIYTYEATIQYQQQERVIPISEDEFEALKPKDTLKAYYDESANDFMSVDFPPNYWQVLGPAFFWLLSILLLRSAFKSQPEQQLSGR